MAPAVLAHPEAWTRPIEEVPTMQAYDTASRLVPGERPRNQAPMLRQVDSGDDLSRVVIDQLLSRLADLISERLVGRLADTSERKAEEWMDARSAAEYLGLHRDTVRKLAAERSLPAHQDGPGCKLFFRRGELDEWRQASHPRWSQLRAVS